MISTPLIDKSRAAIKYSLIFKTASQFFGGIAMILIVRALTEAEYGIYSILYSIISFIGMIASLGINNTLQRYIPEYYQKDQFILAHSLYRTASFSRFITNIMIMGSILLLWQEIAPALKLDGYKPYFMLFTLIIFLDMQRNMLDICLSSFFLQKYSKSVGCLFPMTKILGYGYIIFYGKDIWYAIITDITAYTIVFIALQVLYFKKIPISQGSTKKFPKTEKKRVLRYAMFYNLNDTGDGLLNSYFDNFIIAVFLNPVAVGAYSFCVTLTIILGGLLPLTYFKDVIQPAFFSANTSGSRNQNTSFFFQNCIKINSLFTVPCFCFLLIFSKDAIALFFGGKFMEYTYILCTIFFFFEVISFPAGLVAQLREKANIVFYSKVFALYNLVADLVLIKYFGIWGAALATGTAVLGKNLFIWYFVKQDASFKGLGGFVVKLTGFWTLATLVLWGIASLISLTWVRFLIGVSGSILAFLLQFQCNLFTPDEKRIWHAFAADNPKLRLLLKIIKM